MTERRAEVFAKLVAAVEQGRDEARRGQRAAAAPPDREWSAALCL